MHEALTHSYKNYAWITSCILHVLLLILLLTSIFKTISFVANKTQENLVDDTNSSIPFVDYDEPQSSPVQGTAPQATNAPNTPSQQEPVHAEQQPSPPLLPDALKEPDSLQQAETDQRTVSPKRPPRRAKSAWIKQAPAPSKPTQQNNITSTGQQLAQQFSSYMQQQKRPAIRGTSPAYDLTIEAYGKRILTAICDASRVYEKSVVIHQKINENIRCTITINKDGKILKVSLEPKTGNADMDKAIEGLCKVSAIPRIPANLATNTFDFTVYFRLGKTQNGLNKVRFVPNTL
jgi:hypothetical protein